VRRLLGAYRQRGKGQYTSKRARQRDPAQDRAYSPALPQTLERAQE